MLLVLVLLNGSARLSAQEGPPPLPYSGNLLNTWMFDESSLASGAGDGPTAVYGLGLVSGVQSNAVEIAGSTSLLAYASLTNGWTNITCGNGTVMFWFLPLWNSGEGPGTYGPLLELGQYTHDDSYGWWSLYLDPWGTNLIFSAQTNGAGGTFLSASIDWTSNEWHFIALEYTPTNSTLYLDGQWATNGSGVIHAPSPGVAASGFRIGGDGSGTNLAQGQFDLLITWDYPVGPQMIQGVYEQFGGGGEQMMMMGQGFAFALFEELGGGSSQMLSLEGCAESGLEMLVPIHNVTNVVVGYSPAGPCDLFYSTDLVNWVYFGRSGAGQSHFNFTPSASSTFFFLGTLQDSDGDTQPDAYELLVSHTDPYDGLIPLEIFMNRPSALSILP